jgi:hypothetical protein
MVPESLPHVEELKTEITCHVDVALLDVSETPSIRRGRFLTVYQNSVLQRLRPVDGTTSVHGHCRSADIDAARINWAMRFTGSCGDI